MVRQDALHAGRFDPGKLLKFGAARVERNAENTAVTVARKWLKNGFAADDVVAGEFDLIGLEQQDLRRIEQEATGDDSAGESSCARDGPDEDATIERPTSAAKLLATNFERLLATEVARLFVGEQFR